MNAQSASVLVIEDEPQIRRVLEIALAANDFRALAAENGREGLSLARNSRPDVVVVDLGLPDKDGVEIIREIRTWASLPIIVLSARAMEAEKIRALDAGADDYVTKPFTTGELLARIRVALRHAAARGRVDKDAPFICGALVVDLQQRKVAIKGETIHLTPIEYKLLTLLVQRAGQVVTHVELLREVWGPAKETENHYLRIYMAGLRRKLETDPARPQYLQTEVGVGYRLMLPEE